MRATRAVIPVVDSPVDAIAVLESEAAVAAFAATNQLTRIDLETSTVSLSLIAAETEIVPPDWSLFAVRGEAEGPQGGGRDWRCRAGAQLLVGIRERWSY